MTMPERKDALTEWPGFVVTSTPDPRNAALVKAILEDGEREAAGAPFLRKPWCTCGDCCGEHGPDVRCLNCPAVECEGRDHDAP